jgi:hypothetical protein
VLSFGGNGTTSVTTQELGSANENRIVCNGNYPGITSFTDIYVFGNLLKLGGSDTGLTVEPAQSTADSSSFSLKVWTEDGDEDLNIMVLGETN